MKTVSMATAGPVEDRPRDIQSHAGLSRLDKHEFLAGESGIRQFLDIGTGIPSANNTHEVAQSVAPTARIV